MTHRVSVSANDLDLIQDGPQPYKLELFQEEAPYEPGDYIYFIHHDIDTGLPFHLIARRVVTVHESEDRSYYTVGVQ